MTITLPPDLYRLLLLYAKDNSTAKGKRMTADQAATEMISFFLQPVKDKLR